MTRAAAVLVAVCLLLAATWFVARLDPAQPRMLFGAAVVDQVEMCPALPERCLSDAQFTAVSLPHFPKHAPNGARYEVTYRFTLTQAQIPDDLPAIFLPQFGDSILIRVNDELVSPERTTADRLHHHWNRPYYASFSRAVVDQPVNRFVIALQAHGFSRVYLHPLYVGSARVLEFGAQLRYAQRLGAVRIMTAVILIGAFATFFLWLTRRHDREYLWISLACLASFILALQIAMPNFLAITWRWWSIWNAALLLYGFCILQYAMIQLDLRRPALVRRIAALLLLLAGAAFVVPVAYFKTGSMLIGAVVAAMAVGIVALFVYRWRASTVWDKAHLPFLILAAGAGGSEYIYHHIAPEFVGTHRANMAISVIALGVFLALMGRLASTLRNYESLTQSMQSTIQTRTMELANAQAQMALIERDRAIEAERKRIMLDLHDGVGGQLVNVLAYMEGTPGSDPVVQGSLEEALRDMALIIDSLDGSDDLDLLLASFRARIEPLLERHDIELDWKRIADPRLTRDDPRAALNVIRIVQESITNSVKHSGADRISLTIGRNSVRIADNGRGFSPDHVVRKTGTNSGIGLSGMKRRAMETEVDLEIIPTAAGTEVVLRWSACDG